jgi:hypothetical protein
LLAMLITTSLEVLVELRPQLVRMDDALRLVGRDYQLQQRTAARGPITKYWSSPLYSSST